MFFILHWIFPLRVKIEYSQLMLAKNDQVLHAFLTSDDKWRMKTELDEIIPKLKKAIVYKEDKYFYNHWGVNPIAISRALFNNILQGHKTSGASTITMQVARLLSPKKRTYANKVIEMFRALQLEWKYSKDEILQIYLNLVPYGGNIEGVKAASLLYFGRMPHQLSLAQITALAIIPNRPTSWVIGRTNEAIVKARNKWLKRFGKANIYEPRFIKAALEEQLQATRSEAPHEAQHLAYRLRSRYSTESIIRTTIDKSKQDKIQQLVANYVRRLKVKGIYNASVLVINNHTKQVEAYLGSPFFYDKKHAGQVDGVKAVRSPGSTLKPLVYALGFDQGKLTPKSTVADVPINLNGYSPENFYKKFNGIVNIETSLANSLNIPAVKALKMIGVHYFINKLREARFEQVVKDEKKLGYSMILGGCGVTLEELTNLFSVYSNGGRYTNLCYLKSDTITTNRKLISSAAAYVITENLTKANRPDLPSSFENTIRIPKVAWKTGTSYGRRDAWSIGYNAAYTVGVWVGNFSGNGVKSLVGAEVATPLLFQVFNAIDYNSKKEWFKAPKDLKVRWVCAETGLPPNSFCESQVIDYYLPLVSPTQKCDHLKKVFVSIDGKESYCVTCRTEGKFKTVLYPNLAPEMVAFYNMEGIAYRKIPPHNPRCTRVFEHPAPVINSLSTNKEYIVDRDDPPELMLTCIAHNEVKTVYWYINDQFYKAASPNDKVFFKPTRGMIKVSCSDDQGKSSSIGIRVLYE
ncbi:penicillin-binding protein 1C [Microscilla marina ATCC 23134]|uniref:peptidoglycan glycosyltransferase n=1 Tax=Microscilla marina ATCC 23134 TaxID=313606 RepID=A1ZNU6_MICM2|nr:penicillin-binding protein 1C [Microscilla marina ATCC 23134]